MRSLGLLLCFASCAGSSGAIGNAIFATSVALAASAGSRAAGGCYASCPVGTTCNASTGYCDAQPCRGRCAANEHCVSPGFFDEHCEANTRVLLQAERRAEPSHDWP